MSKDANSFGHDKALAWESRGFVYTKRGCIVSTHPPIKQSEIPFDVIMEFEHCVQTVFAENKNSDLR